MTWSKVCRFRIRAIEPSLQSMTSVATNPKILNVSRTSNPAGLSITYSGNASADGAENGDTLPDGRDSEGIIGTGFEIELQPVERG
jgi:hypothetical protein